MKRTFECTSCGMRDMSQITFVNKKQHPTDNETKELPECRLCGNSKFKEVYI